MFLCVWVSISSELATDDVFESYQATTRFVKLSASEESYLKFLTDKQPMFQRALRLSTATAIWQFIQAYLEILPRWPLALKGLSTSWTFVLGGSLVLLNVVGAVWGVEWAARHIQYDATPLSTMTPMQWEIFGMTLLTAWIVWFLLLTWRTSTNVTTCSANQHKLNGLFQRLKYSFVIGQGIIFVRACLHPNMGFVHAQLELTIINLLLPSIYVISLVMLWMMSMASVKSLLFAVPTSFGLAALIFTGSKMTQKPHSFVVVFLFLFDILIRSWQTASSANRIPRLVQEMLRSSVGATNKAPRGHRYMKVLAGIGVVLFLVFVAVLSGFSTLSVLQSHAKWFPDATSVEYHGDATIEIHHTAIVKLHLGLANASRPAMHLDQPRYASCGTQWHGLGLVDYALLAEAAYFNPLSNDTAKFVSSVVAHNLGDIEVRLPQLNTKTGSKLDFYEAFIPALNTSVIAVRGTDIWRFTDFVEDAKMFVEPVIFSILSAIFPSIRIWPDVTFSTLIELYSELIALFGLQHDFWYYHELLEYVESIPWVEASPNSWDRF
ncbi:hypothetical protein PINS_up024144 [Pythium insidiosum]|nr:hypothetical protein PINS_up024144 [Pythium insidiosum]